MKFSLHRRSRIVHVHGVFLKTFLRITKLIVLILTTACLQVSAFTYGQTITLSVHDATLENVFNKIKAQSEYRFWYESKLLNQTKKVTIEVKNASIKQVMDICLANQPLTYNIIKKVIVIKRKNTTPDVILPTSPPKDTLHGKIINEQGTPVPGATIRIKGTQIATISDDNGNFTLSNAPDNTTLIISSIGYAPKEYTLDGSNNFSIGLAASVAHLDSLAVTVSTGYQDIPKERATGSFVQIDNKLLNRSVSTNILDRLKGNVSGLIFNGEATEQLAGINYSGYSLPNLGITIRGQSTIQANENPLIVVDHFPYKGDISNINPNDIESITILKDAAAASIWGANAGNGVIVITTKKGRKNKPLTVEFNTNITIQNKPDLYYDRNFLNASDYIDVETLLFNNGFFDYDLENTSSYPAISPTVQILAKEREGTLSSKEADEQLNILRQKDVRKDFEKYVYQKSIRQQYYLGLNGGSKDYTYRFSIGRDDNRNNLKRNGFKRTTISLRNTFTPIKNLIVIANLNYSNSATLLNNQLGYENQAEYGMGNYKYNSIYPYAQFADEKGNALPLAKGYNSNYIKNAVSKGFLDWSFRPLDEIKNASNETKRTDFLMHFSVKYQFIPQLNIQLQYQNQHQKIDTRINQNQQTYYTRNLINQFSEYDNEKGIFTYNFPKGDILHLGAYDWKSNNLRAQLNYNQQFNKNNIVAIAGAEIRELKTTGFLNTLYGYDDQFGTAITSLNYDILYQLTPSGYNYIPSPSSNVVGALYRYISYFSNIAYTYDQKYTFTLSGRKDGANIFGAKTNDRVTPLWSAGLGWNISKESFYNVQWLPKLNLRMSYGFNGNVYQGSAYLGGSYGTNTITGAKTINISVAPNPELRWERVKNINLGIDFVSKNSRLSGTLEFYKKNGQDLLERVPLSNQTGFSSYTANAAATHTKGIDFTLHSQNIQREFRWNSTILFSYSHEKLVKYDVVPTSGSVRGGKTGFVGYPLYSVFSYKWAGLNPENGNPQGYINGKISEDYNDIIKNYDPDSLIFNGAARPTIFGAFRNDFSYRGISLSVNIIYKLGYVFRISSARPNYTDILSYYANVDYTHRWQKPGDEKHTNVPSYIYPSNSSRATFYTYSDALVESGSHIRLQDVRISYDIPRNWLDANFFNKLQVYVYANNLGIIWRKNDYGIDPDAYGWGLTHSLPNPFSISFGLSANF